MNANKYLLFFLILISCSKEKKSLKTSFEKLDASKTGIEFANNVANTEEFNVLTYRNFFNGGGVGIGDINNDGLKDIYFTSNTDKNKLYLNKGDFKFEDITEKAGVGGNKSWSTGVTMVDVNQDGLLDIYVCNSGDSDKKNLANELFINQGNNTFKELAEEYGLNDVGLSTHASFFDYDLDGDLDCYVLNNSYKDPQKIASYKQDRFEYGTEGGDRLYKNENGKYIDATKESGIFSSNIGFGLGISVGDVNNDNYPDIYISNDFWERDYLYINNKNGTFTEKLPDNMSYSSVSSMGSDIADINNDGNLDIFTTDMLPPENMRIKAATKFDDFYQEDIKYKYSYYHQFVQNCLQVNRGDGTFQETAHFSGVAATDWSWGALIFDMDLDGLKDIFVSNGIFSDITDSDFVEFIGDKDKVKEIVTKKGKFDFRDFASFLPPNKRNNYAFLNMGNLKFQNEAEGLELKEESFSNGASYGDLDNDGDFDLVINNVNAPAFIYKNKAVENNQGFLKLTFNGSDLNRNGIGTSVLVFSDTLIQKNQVMASRGFQSSVDTDLIFGLGKKTSIDSFIVIWPDKKYQVLKNIKVNSKLVVNYKEASGIYREEQNTETRFTENTIQAFGLLIKHIENQYNDFDFERLMPHMLSAESPKIIKGDINGDNIEDFILTSSSGNSPSVFINKLGKYIKTKQPELELELDADIISGCLVDIDNDKDLDLILGKGGNEPNKKIENYQVSTYINDGKGNFKKINLFDIKAQISVIKACDYDKDGNIDLFLGGRSIPGVYGLSPRSYLMKNLGAGQWMDVTNEYSGPLGMVTDAIWVDTNNDTWQDLIIVGEWMPITILVNNMGELASKVEVPFSAGWWNCIKEMDIDQDGDLDFIIGNWGENIKYKASYDKPLNMYIYDFAGNKKPSSIIEWYAPEDTKPFPFASKVDLTSQYPFLRKTVLKYRDYGAKQVTDLFPKGDIEKSIKKTVVNFQTSILYNNNGNYILKPFAIESQLSPVFGIGVGFIDEDKIPDIYLGGNFYKLKPEIGRHDAFNGGYYKGLGKGKYKYISAQKSGIITKGEVKDAVVINGSLLVSRNNDYLQMFTKK